MKLIKLNAIDSTNEYIKINKSIFDKELVCIYTFNQTMGKGQRGRNWESEPYKNLCVSFYKLLSNKASKDILFKLNMIVSLKMIRILKKYSIPKLSIKWPNDILSENKKIGGILIENFFTKGKLTASVIGVGLNLNQLSFQNIPNATSLRKVTGIIWDQQKLLDVLMQYLNRFLFQTNFQNLDNILIQYNDKLWKKNERVAFESNSSNFMAIPKGVSIEGKLIIETDEKQILEKDTNQIRMLYNPNLL